MNSVYLDNSSLEVYHGRLDERPNAITIRVSWQGPEDPQVVDIERKSQKSMAKGYEDIQDKITLPEPAVIAYLEGDLEVQAAKDFWQQSVSAWAGL